MSGPGHDDLPGGDPTGRSGRARRPRTMALAVLLAALALGGCKTDLYTKLSEREANEMVALLVKHGIPASRNAAKDGTSNVQVEEKRFADAIELLKASGFPRQSFTNMGEVFKSSGLIASPTEERARFVYALSEELSRTISDIDGVLSARIHVVLPKNDLLRQDTTPSSASVFIRHDQGAPLKTLLPQIKMLVANSIEGLSYEKVSVVLVPVDRTAASTEAIDGAPQAGFPVPASAAGFQWDEPGPFHAMAAAALALVALVGGLAFWLGGRRGGRAAPAVATPVNPQVIEGDVRASLPGPSAKSEGRAETGAELRRVA